METVITVLIVVAAGFWCVRWLRGSAKGQGGCGCGKCAKNCAQPSKFCMKVDKD